MTSEKFGSAEFGSFFMEFEISSVFEICQLKNERLQTKFSQINQLVSLVNFVYPKLEISQISKLNKRSSGCKIRSLF